jgi:prophage regulatory protein
MTKQRYVRIVMISHQDDDRPGGCSRTATVLIGLRRTIRRHELRLIVPLADTTICEIEKPLAQACQSLAGRSLARS